MGSRKAKSRAPKPSATEKGAARPNDKQMSTSTQNAFWPTLVEPTPDADVTSSVAATEPVSEAAAEVQAPFDKTDALEEVILTEKSVRPNHEETVEDTIQTEREFPVKDSNVEEGEITEAVPPEHADVTIQVTSAEDLNSSNEMTEASFEESLLALGSIRGLGRKSLIALFDAFKGDLGHIWKIPSEQIETVLDGAKIPAAEKISTEIVKNRFALLLDGKNKFKELFRRGIHIIPLDKLPAPLRDIPDPPRWLFVEGDSNLLYHKPAVAVVGTRKPTANGIKATTHVTKQLACYQFALVSGLAEGIDEEAHRSSLQDGIKNVAFLGHGINLIFPSSTKSLREQIVQDGGAIVTEYMPNERYQRHYFVERNRLQAALSQLVIPVQANPKGGTAHTIKFARQLKREIVGIRWQGANGILDDLTRDGYPVVEIFTPQGRKQLDKILRNLAEQFNHPTYAFAVTERRLRNEIKSRDVRKSDIEQLIVSLEEMSKEI